MYELLVFRAGDEPRLRRDTGENLMLQFQASPPDGLMLPVLVCDACGQTIDDPGMAGVVYRQGSAVGDLSNTLLLCKFNRCLRNCLSEGPTDKPWWEVTWVLNHLLGRDRVAGIDDEKGDL